MLHPGGGVVHSHLSKDTEARQAATVGMAPEEDFIDASLYEVLAEWTLGLFAQRAT